MTLEVVAVDSPPVLPARVSPDELKAQANECRELMKAVLARNIDYGQIPGTPKPSLYKSGAEWLLKWARLGHRLVQVDKDRNEEGRPTGVTYRCEVFLLDDSSSVVATCDGYAGRDEPKWAKAPWNTILKMAQKRALVGATLQATATSGLFTQDVEDMVDEDAWFKDNGWGGRADHDRYRQTVLEVLKAAPPDQQAAFKQARVEAQVPAFNQPHTKAQADWVSSHLFEFVTAKTDDEAEEAELVEEDEMAELFENEE